ncbi:MAG: diguanylate cyclase [Helicobacteraceae bacterium]|jgi:diguanylate cyclase (GGDEF)-like protein|nr:diguanylate cyclase [Helicobacteraceae bacterium]
MSLSEAIKNALEVFRQTKEPITPENYRRVFCAEAKKLGLNLHDCNFIARAIENLSPRIKKEAEAYRIRTQEELIVFLTSRLNQATSSSSEFASLIVSTALVRRLLVVIEAMGGELGEEAKFSLERDMSRPLILEDEKRRWTRLQSKSAPNLLTRRLNEASERIKTLEATIKEFHSALEAQNAENSELARTIERGEASGDNFLSAFKKTLANFNSSLKNRTQTIGDMQSRIDALEEELAKSKREALRDETTKAPNRRSINADLEEREREFDANKTDYVAVFLEIDDFENLLNELGIGSFETVLSIAADFLSKSLPQNATYGHYIGHTFLMLIVNQTKSEIETALQTIVTKMASKRFVYENRNFNVTLSVGAALRSQCKSEGDCISAADAALRFVKLNGGNAYKAAL